LGDANGKTILKGLIVRTMLRLWAFIESGALLHAAGWFQPGGLRTGAHQRLPQAAGGVISFRQGHLVVYATNEAIKKNAA